MKRPTRADVITGIPLFFVWFSVMVASLFNWLFNIFLNRWLPLSEFSQVFSLFNSILILAGLALAFQYTATKFLPQQKYIGDDEQPVINSLLTIGIVAGCITSGLLIVTIPQWSSYLHLTLPLYTNVFLALTPFFFFNLAIVRGFIYGRQNYWLGGSLVIFESVIKLIILMIGYFMGNLLVMSILSIPVSMFISLVVGIFMVGIKTLSRLVFTIEPRLKQSIRRFISFSFLTATGAQLCVFVDTITVRHYFSGSEAGIYATVALVGKMIFYLITSMVLVIAPEVSVRTAAQKGSIEILKRSLLFCLVIGVSSTLLFAFFPDYSLKLFLDPLKISAGQYLILPYGIAVTLISLVTIMATYYLFAGFHRFIWSIYGGLLLELVLFSLYHDTLSQIVTILILIAMSQTILIPLLVKTEKKDYPVNHNSA